MSRGAVTGPDPLAPYVPRLVIDWLRTTPHARRRTVEGTLAFVDISGFTKLTERLARGGKVGAEEMSDILDATFSALLGVAYEDGAGLVKWGGDAVLLLFDGPDHAARACRAAHRMRAMMREVGRLTTSAGQVTLRMSVGVHSGAFDFFLVGDPTDHRELLVSGPAATTTADMEALADAGQIAMSPATASLLDPRSVGAAKGAGFLLRSAPDGPPAPAPPPQSTDGLDLGSVIPSRIRDRLAGGRGSPEHRTVTIAFVQFSGTDALVRRSGPEALTDALDECIRNVQDAVAAHEVTFFETDINRDGGKIMLTAGAPVTADHDEERMLRAVRRVVDRIGVLPLRVGVNRGGVFAGDFGPPFRRTFSVKGDAVNLAARVMGKARPGQVLATLPVLERSRTVFDVELLPPFMVKGKAHPVEAASVGPVAGARHDAASRQPLVGRDAEMKVLLAALDDVRDGTGRAVEIVGEPGIGKSRLVSELRDDATGTAVVAAACSDYEVATPYAPFRALLREVLGVPRTAPADTVHDALVDRVGAVAPHLLPWLPATGPLLDLRLPDTPETRRVDPRFRRTRLEEVTVEILGALVPGPALVVLDDVHLMDDASVRLLERIIAEVHSHAWLVVVSRRDTLTGYRPAEDADVASIRPGPLERAASLELLGAGTVDAALLPHEMDVLVERAEGNPFFLGALVSAAVASGGVDALPDSLESVLNSQIDRLPPDERTVLRHAAVLGLAFTEADLRALLVDEELPTSRSSMRHLAEFVEADGHGRLRFKHALIRDAAYAGLPVRRRRALHGRVGETIEASAVSTDEQADLLALHFYEAGRMDKAWRYARVAADRAARKYAFVSAADLLTRATQAARGLTDVDPDDLASAYEDLADAQLHIGVLPEARTAYRAARLRRRSDPLRTADLLRKEATVEQRLDRVPQALRTLSRALGVIESDDRHDAQAERARLMCAYARCREKQGRYRDAVRWGRQAETTARSAGDRRAMAEAYEALHSASSMAGLDQPEPYGALALELFTELGDREAQSRALNNLAVLAWFEGHGDDALAMFERARDAAAEAGDTLGSAASAHNVGDVLLRQGRADEADAVLRPLLAVFKGLRSDEYWASTLRWLGLADVRRGRVEQGRLEIERAREVMAGLGLAAEVAETDTAVAEALLASGEPEHAADLAADAMRRARALDAGYLLPSMHRLRGEALLASGRTGEAVPELEAALVACRTEGAAERGFVLADLARAVAEDDPVRSGALVMEATAALGALGHVGLAAPPR